MSERELKNLLDDTAKAWAEKKRKEKEERGETLYAGAKIIQQRKVAREVRRLETLIAALKFLGLVALVAALVLVLVALANAGERRAEKGAKWEEWVVTGYSHGCTKPKSGVEHKEPQLTASGKAARVDWTVAGPPHLPFGTRLELAHRGVVALREVQDRGRAIRGKRLDLFLGDCVSARSWGKQRVWVRVLGQGRGRGER